MLQMRNGMVVLSMGSVLGAFALEPKISVPDAELVDDLVAAVLPKANEGTLQNDTNRVVHFLAGQDFEKGTPTSNDSIQAAWIAEGTNGTNEHLVLPGGVLRFARG